MVASLDHCDDSAATIRQQLLDSGADENATQRIPDDWSQCRFGPADQLVLDFAAKVARNANQIVPGDTQNFRDAGINQNPLLSLEVDTGSAVLHQVVEIDPLPVSEAARLRSEAAEALAEWLDWWVEGKGRRRPPE